MMLRKSMLVLVAAVGFGLGFTSTSRASDLMAEFSQLMSSVKLGRTEVGLSVVRLKDDQTLVSYHADTPMMPASNMKLVTTATALGTLGPDFRFQTELAVLDARPDAAVLLVKGDGDPALGDQRLLQANHLDVEQVLGVLVKAVQGAGIKHVAKLILDDRVFDRQWIHPLWPRNQLGDWYCAPVSGLNFNDNCLNVYAAPAGGGQPPVIQMVPDCPFLHVVNQAMSGGEGNFIARLGGKDGWDLLLNGGVRHRSVAPIYLPVPNPPVFFGRILADRLQRAGIGVDALAVPGPDDRLPEGKPIYYLRTSLLAVLHRCDKDSQNLFAECLLKRCGRALTGNPGSWENGAAAVRSFMAQRIGSRAAGLVIVDGSGLSRENRVSPVQLTALLTSMAHDPKLAQPYMESLSVAGEDGTLERRLKSGLHGEVFGKTGYINGVSTFSGYLLMPGQTEHRPVVAFSFMFNHVPGNVSIHDVKKLQDDFVRVMDREMVR